MTIEQPLILLTTDFSEEAARAYEKTADLARRIGGRILLAHVVEVTAVAPHGAALAPTQFPPDVGEAMDRAGEHLRSEAARFASDVPVEVVAVADSNAADGICRLARERDASLVAISTHGRTGLRRLLLGSVAEAVVRHSPVPVLTFPHG